MTFTFVEEEAEEEDDEEEGTSPRVRNAHTVDVDPRRGVEVATVAVKARRSWTVPAGAERNVGGAAAAEAVVTVIFVACRATTDVFLFFLRSCCCCSRCCGVYRTPNQKKTQRGGCAQNTNGLCACRPYLPAYIYTLKRVVADTSTGAGACVCVEREA